MGGKLKEVNGPTDCVIRFTNGNIERNRFPKKEKINQKHFFAEKKQTESIMKMKEFL